MIRVVYNNQVQPPAPFILVNLSDPLTGLTISEVPAQLDTAADRTLVPLSLLESLGLAPIDDILIGGVGGNTETMPVFVVSMGIFALPTRNRLVVAHPAESWVLLGRDVLNLHRSLLDGPNLSLEIE